MKEKFKDIRISQERLAMIAFANDVIEEYVSAGYRLSLRQLYYQFVARDKIENTERSYKNLGNVINDGRMAGLIDWDAIQDRGRELVVNPHWNSIGEIIESCATQFRFDLWADQTYHVEVMVEKQALEGVLQPICQKLDIGFTANKGYSSQSAMYEAGKRMAASERDGKSVMVFYLGDHDPSGIDMSRDVRDRLACFMGLEPLVNEDFWENFEVRRLALNLKQVHELNPPPNPAKMTDSRAHEYVRKFGNSSWELDAIEPKHLARIVESQVSLVTDAKKMKAAIARQSTARKELAEIAKKHI